MARALLRVFQVTLLRRRYLGWVTDPAYVSVFGGYLACEACISRPSFLNPSMLFHYLTPEVPIIDLIIPMLTLNDPVSIPATGLISACERCSAAPTVPVFW